MKTTRILAVLLALAVSTFAAEENDYGHGNEKAIAGPNGGRVITGVEPHVEFLVQDDRHVRLTFYNDDMKPVAATDQKAEVFAGDRSAPTNLKFGKKGAVLVSDAPLPEGGNVPTVLRLTMTPGGETVTEKFNVNMAKCPTCEFNEYACICGH